jgi:aryl-phospho-beta-D-glucosidase BglC (GH1 family)
MRHYLARRLSPALAAAFLILIGTFAPPARPAAALPGAAYERGVNLSGGEYRPDVIPGALYTDYIYPTRANFDYYRAKGFTVARFAFDWKRVQPTLGQPLDEAKMAELDRVLADATAAGIRVIPEPHNYARYRLGTAPNFTEALIGSPQVPYAAFRDFWQRFAARYKDNPAIYAYNLMNEPHDTGGLWVNAGAQAGVDGVRAAGSTQLILVPGDDWTGAHRWTPGSGSPNLSLAVTDPAGNFMYEAHQYFDADNSGRYQQSYDGEGAYPTVGVDRVKGFTAWCRTRNARCFLGEYGVPRDDARWNTVLDNFLAHLDVEGIGGTYWLGGGDWVDPADHLNVWPTGAPGAYVDRPQMPTLVAHPSSPGGTPALANLALNRSATADSACDGATEAAAKAVDGSVGTKWCSGGASKFLQVDLGGAADLSRFVVRHAGAGNDPVAWNTRDFTIAVSADGTNFTTVVTVTGNTANVTTHTIAMTRGRYVRLDIAVPTSDGSTAARIFELEAYGTPVPTASGNLTLNRATTGSTPCDAATEGGAKAVDGSTGTKFCTGTVPRFLQVDLGAPQAVSRVVIKHAGAGNDPAQWNTRDFTVRVSADGATYTTVATVTGNVASETTHTFTAVQARYVRLDIAVPTSDGSGAARIFEFEVYP